MSELMRFDELFKSIAFVPQLEEQFEMVSNTNHKRVGTRIE